MNANRENPFNSPPSSTGSHRAASPTLSSVFSDPEGESTRRLNEDIARVTAPRKLSVNWEAAHRKWPEFYSLPTKTDRPIFDDITSTETQARPLHIRSQSKENLDPLASAPGPIIAKYIVDDTTEDAWSGSKRTRAEMQPRVDNESDLSSILSKSPARGMGAFAAATKNAHAPSPLSKTHTSAPPPPSQVYRQQRDHKQDPLSDAFERLRRTSSSPRSTREPRSHDESSPNMSSAKSSLTAVPTSPSTASPGHDNTNMRSFFMPDVTHLGDFVTGTLRFTGSAKNGVPILVKHGKVHDQNIRPFGARHAEVDGVVIPEEEGKIFVSMDMIRQEIVSLQDNHDKIQEYAGNLQREVERLQAQLNSRKSFENRLGMDRANEQVLAQKKGLEAEVASLQARLDQANQRVSSRAIENDTLAQERDRVMSRLQEACDDINKLTRKLVIKEKELETTSKQLGSSEQTRQENDTLRRDLADLRQSRQGLESENTSLRTDNEGLRKEVKHLRQESESLRSDNKSLRSDHKSLLSENRSLRKAQRTHLDDEDQFRDNVDGLQQELDAAREEVESLQQELRSLKQEKSSLRQDNDSLVRHNEKYFNENKILRRENSGFERSIHGLHDEISKLKEEVVYLKEQLDQQCRPIPKRDLTAAADDETEDNMTSAFFVPDITINSDDSGPLETLPSKALSSLPNNFSGTKNAASLSSNNNNKDHESRTATKRDGSGRTDRPTSKSDKSLTQSRDSGHVQKVAFSLPEKSTESSKAYSTQANKGSKRKSASIKAATNDMDAFGDHDDTTGILSVDNTTQDQSVSMSLTFRSIKETEEPRPMARSDGLHKSQRSKVSSKKANTAAQEAIRSVGKDSCPALSNNARRVLDSLCVHSCQNCMVCSRITSHNGIASSRELAAGKKRVTVPRPVPVSERQGQGDDMTVRPTQPPGHALALVIKGLEDESQHLQLELIRLQAQYNGSDKSQGRKERLHVAHAIKMILKQLEVKNDQIYSLYDVLEGQKAVGQAMSEEEIELTVLNIAGIAVRDVVGASHGNHNKDSWEGVVAD
ncbi:Intracellular protein transport protein USO1 [Escovopsis weberi]|uniref:Intracellular protein transport protein USO1 n=1 Tax=Escovopsis weberi TaxID=150374 RepID=A0A0M9VSF6_ESCWE|nr:Intracellular protein transport protein USO1 [Escovopsis weberi]